MLEVHRSGRSAVHDAYLREHGLTRLDPRDGAALLDGVTRLSFQFPGEHCTECAAPDCHGSCDLFERGSTGRCKRFADGIVVRRGGVGAIPYVLEVLFRPWGHFLAVANTLCVEPRAYRRLAWWIPTAGRLSYLLQSALRPLPPTLHWRVSDKIRGAGNYLPRLLNRLAQRPGRPPPDALLCIAGNPQREPVQIELSLSGFGASQGGRSVRRAAAVPHGWHALAIGTDEIRGLIDLGKLFRFSVVPLIEKPALLQFLYVGFVTRGGTPAAGGKEAEKKVKLAVLDLDNTLWDGVLIENPDKEFALLPGVRATLEELDRRGILLSVASKNYPEEGRKVLEKLGLWALFLHP
jgi:hypothetical protein